MGLFSWSKDTEVKRGSKEDLSKLPQLPDLPPLYSFPNSGFQPMQNVTSNSLPRFPNNSVGDNVSQNIIKHAVSGQEDGDDLDNINEVELQEPSSENHVAREYSKFENKKSFSDDESDSEGFTIKSSRTRTEREEPVFVRIDKFDNTVKTLEDVKSKIQEVDKILDKLKKLKIDEEAELNSWEKELDDVKSQIDRLDRDVFSKV